MTDRAVKVWTDALEVVMRQVLGEMHEQVLSNLLEKERQRDPSFKIINASELDWTAEDERNYCAEKEAASLLVQVLTRSITNNFSKQDAARILFRDHYGRGTGSGWLPDYLDGLPGITVDKAKCIKVANSAGPSEFTSWIKTTSYREPSGG